MPEPDNWLPSSDNWLTESDNCLPESDNCAGNTVVVLCIYKCIMKSLHNVNVGFCLGTILESLRLFSINSKDFIA